MTASTTDKSQKQLLGKLHFKSILLVETGLHIGGGGETLSIGGLDKPIIRDPITRHPYLPGSSIKGKLRAILERLCNKPLNRSGSRDTYRYESDDLVDGITEIDRQYIKFEGAKNCEISRVFGSTGVTCWIETEVAELEGLLEKDSRKKQIDGKEYAQVKGRNAPARLIVRDAHLQKDSAKELKEIDTGLYMTEWKFENGINRVTAAANPRQVERVPKGAKFEFEMVYTVENREQAVEDFKNLVVALGILQDDALGGHGSRGYGKVSFKKLKFFCRTREQYLNPSGDFDQPFAEFEKLSDVFTQFGNLTGGVENLFPKGENK